jgi:hypothetical protein
MQMGQSILLRCTKLLALHTKLNLHHAHEPTHPRSNRAKKVYLSDV